MLHRPLLCKPRWLHANEKNSVTSNEKNSVTSDDINTVTSERLTTKMGTLSFFECLPMFYLIMFSDVLPSIHTDALSDVLCGTHSSGTAAIWHIIFRCFFFVLAFYLKSYLRKYNLQICWYFAWHRDRVRRDPGRPSLLEEDGERGEEASKHKILHALLTN